jgi:DNA repair protein RecN (Recombination protein N)
MLTDLTIKNFAIIDELRAQFGPGLNALTGETGAGKSILVDAINLLLGSRASSEMIRTGHEEASVEAYFDLEDAKAPALLKNLDLAGSEGLQIRRLIHRSGKSRAFLNGSTITLHMLEELGEELINVYGQHEHQHFLDPLRHIDILDSSGRLLPLRGAFQEVYARWTRISSELQGWMAKQKQHSDRLEFLAYQSNEIARVKIKPGEDEELNSERARLVHAEKLHAIAFFGAEVLYGESGSVVERLKATLQRLREGAKLDPSLEPLIASVESTLFQAEDVAASLRAYGEKIYFDPGRLEAIESRLDEINRLKKKYGPSLDQVLAYQDQIDLERQDLGNPGERVARLQKITSQEYDRALGAAGDLSQARKKISRELETRVEKELTTLGMKKARFQILVEADGVEEGEGVQKSTPRLHDKGMDRVHFLLSPNPGEDLKPLARIASGGELSRIMLAMKRIFAEETLAKTLIFDEVDAGIGGGIAEIVGRKLKEISRNHQVFCITHLPQIASFADAHFKVVKKETGGRTSVEIRRLTLDERLEEIARMLGGIKITGTAVDHAREILKNAIKG